METIYENAPCVLATDASIGNRSHRKGNSRKAKTAKWSCINLILAVSLVFALGGFCVLCPLYTKALKQLSKREAEISDLKALKQLSEQEAKSTIMKEITANCRTVKEQPSIFELFTAQPLHCEEKITAFQGKLYFFGCVKLTWSSSRDFCLSKGADLVTITSEQEQKFLYSKISTWYWIGLNDLDTEGNWVWVNNQTLHETGVKFWINQTDHIEPDNWKQDDPSGENCAIVKTNDDFKNSWSDASCEYKVQFICEKKYPAINGAT